MSSGNVLFSLVPVFSLQAIQSAYDGLRKSGRPSVSGLLVDLVQRHRKELERELN